MFLPFPFPLLLEACCACCWAAWAIASWYEYKSGPNCICAARFACCCCWLLEPIPEPIPDMPWIPEQFSQTILLRLVATIHSPLKICCWKACIAAAVCDELPKFPPKFPKLPKLARALSWAANVMLPIGSAAAAAAAAWAAALADWCRDEEEPREEELWGGGVDWFGGVGAGRGFEFSSLGVLLGAGDNATGADWCCCGWIVTLDEEDCWAGECIEKSAAPDDDDELCDAIRCSISCSCWSALTKAVFKRLVCSALRAFFTLVVTQDSHMMRGAEKEIVINSIQNAMKQPKTHWHPIHLVCPSPSSTLA